MHGTQPYDPVKAHDYYIKNRKLKGRKKGAPQPSAPKQSSSKVDPALKDSVFKGLPIAKAGMSAQEVGDFLKWSVKQSNDALRQNIVEYKQEKSPANDAKAATLELLLKNREGASNKSEPAKKVAPSKKANPKAAARQLKAVTARVNSIKQELADLNDKLKKAMASARKTAAKEKRGPTAADKSKAARESKKYRQKNKQKLANSRKRSSSKAKSKSGPKKDSVADLKKKISEVQGRLDSAVKKQKSLSSAAKNG